MRDDDNRLAAFFELGKQLGIEEFFELRILIRRPLVEEIKRAVFEVGRQESKAFALALGKGGCGKFTVINFHFVVEVQAIEIVFGPRIQSCAAQTEQAFEKVKVGEDN